LTAVESVTCADGAPVSTGVIQYGAIKAQTMKNFLKRKDANTPQKLIIDSDDGQEFFLMVVSSYADVYKAGKQRVMREAAETMTASDFVDENQFKLVAKILATTVTSWSMPEEFGECTPENVEALLLEYPQICEAVDEFFSDNGKFIEKKFKA